MNVQQINMAIMSGGLSNEDLNNVIEAVKWARTKLAKQTKRSLMLGDNVNFTSSKTGQNVTGVVTKIAIKYVTVRTINGLWRVPANMLTRIDEEELA